MAIGAVPCAAIILTRDHVTTPTYAFASAAASFQAEHLTTPTAASASTAASLTTASSPPASLAAASASAFLSKKQISKLSLRYFSVFTYIVQIVKEYLNINNYHNAIIINTLLQNT